MTLEIKELLQRLSDNPIFKDFYFIGGTALAYYLNHRISYDLDFITTSKLKSTTLKTLAIQYDALYIPDTNASVFKINTGSNIEEYKMMFNINGIKLEFFYPNDLIQEEIVSKYKNESSNLNQSVKILPLQAIAELKILALFKRAKIRDLFDSYVLLEQDKITIELLEKFYALVLGKETIVEFIENFQDDGSESLDFQSSNKYCDQFINLEHSQKLEKIKKDFIALIVKQELKKKAHLK